MNNSIADSIINEIVETIEIPDSAYEKAEQRYRDIGDWLGRPESNSFYFAPHIFPQGSFRLGTVVRPINSDDEYDLDLACQLCSGITKNTHTQQWLKKLVGDDLESYRIARNIKEIIEEKRRCWRLNYLDILKFHMDILPSIPETLSARLLIKEAMINTGESEALAQSVSDLTSAITDNQLYNYNFISNDWKVSNQEGYALWFESRMKLAKTLLDNRAIEERKARVDELPVYRWKTPLQKCVQILKRHRDVMFVDNPDSKPISPILATLAGRAYQGEVEITESLSTILSNMANFVRPRAPRVPNPVNPPEDFADKWDDIKYRHHQLEKNFWLWLEQAKADFQVIESARDVPSIVEHINKSFSLYLNADSLKAKLGNKRTSSLLKEAAVPEGLSFPPKPIIPSKPGGFA